MIDLITLVKPCLSEAEIATLVEKNDLQTNSSDGLVYYDNQATKNLKQQQGVFIRVETNHKLRVECSLQKFYSEISAGERSNYGLFSMPNAKEAIKRLLADKAIAADDLRVYSYEIGLNLTVSKSCRAYLDKLKSIGATDNERQLYVNPRYKDERVKTTVFHNHTRKYFKVYDKVFEMMDKKRKQLPDGNILRIETAYRRLDNCFATDFFSPDNLTKLLESFFRDWRTVQFHQDIVTPKGTGRAKQQLCIELIDKGKETILKQAKERYKNASLTDWEYRNTREFITKEWDAIKKQIRFIQSDEEKEFRQLLNTSYTLLKNEEFSC